MCGLCGILRATPGAAAPDPGELARLSAALAARGPDGAGEWASADGRLRLAHRRLAVIDLSPAGAQPMTSADGRYTIVYNGEIYNYRELGDELAARGTRFRSSSDSETVLELWRREGVAGVARLRGMFAFALWDEAAGELVLVRDPYGIKPLYYALDRGTLRFASQVRALLAGGGLSREIDAAGVAGYLAWGAVPEPLTLHRAIRALPAGHWARIGRDGALRIAPLPRPAPAPAASAAEAVERSVRAHLVSDVPVGLFLSAGLDSALVAALAARAGGERPTALTLTWAEARGAAADEEPLARATAAALGLRHVVREISGTEVRAALPAILAAMDQPSIDGFNTWLVARVAREEGLKVALSGLGGDELLGGYASFRDVPRWRRWGERLARLPAAAALWPRAVRAAAPRRPKLAALAALGGSLAGAYVLRRGLFLPAEIDALLAGAGLAAAGDRRLYDAPLDAWERLGEATLGTPDGLVADPWRAVHRLESSLYLRHQLLRDADWAGMAHGVEIRVPLVDARLRAELEALDFAPARTGGKAALVAAAAPELPAALRARPKTGFQLPLLEWLDPDGAARARTQGERSRRLALRVLAELGVEIPLAASGRVT